MSSDPENTAATRANKANVITSEAARQTSHAALKKTFETGGSTYATYAAAVKAADIVHYRTCLASCLQNNVQPGVITQALHDLGTGGT
jgi:hypothetical protein